VNVHASLLPKYRGAAPITWAVVRGELETGVTLMKLDEGMDTGPTFARFATPLDPDETSAELSERLARLGAEAVRSMLPAFVAGDITLEPQDESVATIAPILRKEDGRVDWTRSARQVHDHVRGMNPWPGAFTRSRDKTLKVHSTRPHGSSRTGPPPVPGEVLVADKTGVVVACGTGCVELVSVQLEGKRAMAGADWAAGRGVSVADVLG
jgi:methionyl-tRNA formyltransferase